MALTERYVSTTGAGTHDGTSEANAFSWAEMITDSATSAAGTRYNIKNDATYSRTTNSDQLGGGSSTAPKIYRGYNDIPGDGYLGRTNNNGPLITTNMPVVTYTTGRITTIGNHIQIESLNVTSAVTGSSSTVNCQTGVLIFRCVVTNTGAASTGLGIITAAPSSQVVECDVSQTNAAGGVAISLGGGVLQRNRIKSTASNGVLCAGAGTNFIRGNLIFENGADGINVNNTASVCYFVGNTIVGNTGDGIDIVAAHTGIAYVEDNMITDNGGYGINANGANSLLISGYNRFRDNTLGNFNGTQDWVTATNWGVVTTDTGGQSTDYVDAPSDNFALISGSPGANAGFPYSSMGAYQLQSAVNLGGNGRIPSLIV